MINIKTKIKDNMGTIFYINSKIHNLNDLFKNRDVTFKKNTNNDVVFINELEKSFSSNFVFWLNKKDLLSKKEFLAFLKSVLNIQKQKNINIINIRIDDNFVFNESLFFDIFQKMEDSQKTYNIITKNPRILKILNIIKNRNSFFNGNKTIIIDLHNVLHLAFYGIPEKKGIFLDKFELNLNLVFFFKSFLNWLLFNSDYSKIYFATESKPNWRNLFLNKLKLSKAFGRDFKSKEHKEKDEDLIYQIEICENIIENLGLPLIKKENYEADDVIASLTKRIIEINPKEEIFIYSSDKDLWQLLEFDNVKIINPKTKEIFDQNNDPALKKFGIDYKNIVNFLALTGDSADGIPGVKNIGLKKAKKIIDYTKLIIDKYKGDEDLFVFFKNLYLKNNNNITDFIYSKLIQLGINEKEIKDYLKIIENIKNEGLFNYICSYELIKLSFNLFNDYDLHFFEMGAKFNNEEIQKLLFEEQFKYFKFS